MSLIVVAVALFGIGRMAFWFGYSHGAGGRAFGMALTALPTAAAYAFAFGLMVFGADQEEPREKRVFVEPAFMTNPFFHHSPFRLTLSVSYNFQCTPTRNRHSRSRPQSLRRQFRVP